MSADLFHAISIFVKVAEARSFTEAARRLGITPSGASKMLARLEERLGVRLVSRTTRRVSLTAEGDVFFDRCRQILAELEDAETTVQGRRTKLLGRFRVQTPVAFGRKIVIPLLARFLDEHKELTVDVALTDRVSDVHEEGVDVLLHIGEVRSSSVVARKLCHLRYVNVASPDYLARYGEPLTPDDLQRHRCLAYYVPHTNRYRDWHFAMADQRLSKAIVGSLNINSAEGLLDAALAGAGVAVVSTFVAADAVKSGQLRIVLRNYVCAGPQISVLYPSRRHLPMRVRAFVDYLTAEVTSTPPWDSILEQ
jgi:LysR family transcriptional regulator for bpeEF and oprC